MFVSSRTSQYVDHEVQSSVLTLRMKDVKVGVLLIAREFYIFPVLNNLS